MSEKLRAELETLKAENESLKDARDVEWRKFVAATKNEQIATLKEKWEGATTELETLRKIINRLTGFPREEWDWILGYLPDDCIDILEENKETEQGEQVMPKVQGQSFRCECGCNVFTKTGEYKYCCNACRANYQGEPADILEGK